MGADGSKGCTPWDCMTNNPHDIGVFVGFRMPRSPFRRQRKMLECASSACCRRRSTVLILANAPERAWLRELATDMQWRSGRC